MVTIAVNKDKLLKRLRLEEDELDYILFNLGSETRVIDNNEVEIEINANRLDLLHSSGIKRAVDGLLERQTGIANYDIYESDYTLVVKSVRARPYALAAVVNGLNLDLEDLKELIQFQEKLHDTIGRKRRKVAIGLHDLRKIDNNVIVYREAGLEEKFVPLYGKERMSIKEILSSTEQGKMYGSISLYDSTMPVIAEENGEILSMPPVINSDKTRIELTTKDLFIDVTGTSLTQVAQTLDVLVSNLAEMGAKIGIVKIKADYAEKSPLFLTSEIKVSYDYLNERLGLKLRKEDLVKQILKSRLGASFDSKEESLKVIVSPYRPDIFREIDIVEEIAMSLGYGNIPLLQYNPKGIGKLSWKTEISRKIRDLSIGAGFQEILSFILTSEDLALDKNYAKITNPISELYNIVRNSLIPQLLLFLSKNQHARFPIKIFEVGEVSIKDTSSDTGFSNSLRVAYGLMDSKVSYENLQAPLHQILANLGLEVTYRKLNSEIFIKGRAAEIFVKDQNIGVIGEVSPDLLLTKFNITYPVVIAEIYLDKLKK